MRIIWFEVRRDNYNNDYDFSTLILMFMYLIYLLILVSIIYNPKRMIFIILLIKVFTIN